MIEKAKQLIEACTYACKGNPFCVPTIIFDNAKTMQWFKKVFVEQKKIFANVRMASLNFFLKEQLELLTGKQITNSNTLAHKIMVYIMRHISKPELEKVKAYCQPIPHKEMQYGKLYDFAMQLADLFLNYQNLEDTNCCFGSSKPNADWQKYLCEKVCADEPTLRKVFQDCSKKPDFGNNPTYYFGTADIEPLYKKILAKWEINEENFFYTDTYSNLESIGTKLPAVNIVAAPSKVRELESVHSHICQLLQDGATLSEMLVVVPNLDDYRTSIHQVFDIPKEKSNVHIPYAIVDADATESFTHAFLKTFFDIAAKDDFSRKDFFEIVNNPVVRAARNITAEEVECFENWIEQMHVFRNGNQRDDWHKAVKRMLLARFTTGTIGDILPFENMNSKSDSTLYKFVRCIDDLDEWLELTKTAFDVDKLEELYDILRNWMLIKVMPPELEMERLSYSGAISACKGLEVWKDAGATTIPVKIVARTVIDGAVTCFAAPAELFVGGLTFMRYNPNSVIPAKYTFLLSMDSKTMPGRDFTNTLDLRPNPKRRSEENKTAFYTTLARTEKQIFFSYINMDLVKDETFFASNLLEELQKEELHKKVTVTTETLQIDENRDFKDLFTSRSIRNKKKGAALFNNSANTSTIVKLDNLDNLISKLELPQRVSLSNLKKFLEDPFQFQIGRLMDTNDLGNSQNAEWEPLAFDNLENWAYLHEMVEKNLDKQEFIDKHKNENALPAAPFDDKAINSLITSKDKILAAMKNEILDQSSNLVKGVMVEQSLTYNGKDWLLCGESSWHTADGKTFVDVTSSTVKDKDHKYLKMYLSALAFWANQKANNKNENIEISLLLFDGDGKKHEKSFTLDNAEKACTILNAIFEAAYVERYHKVVPIEIVKEDLDYYKYLSKFGSYTGSCWKYFNKKILFKIEEVCGFDEGDFKSNMDTATDKMNWDTETGKMKEIIKFLN